MAEKLFWSDETSNWNSTWSWTLPVLCLIVICRFFAVRFHSKRVVGKTVPKSQPKIESVGVVTDLDLKKLMENLDENSSSKDVYESVIDKRNDCIAYRAKCCKPKDGGPLKYLSVTTFEECPVEQLLGFYMDNEYRMEWDKTVVRHEQLEMDESSGTEIGRTVKKFPLLTQREYVLAWRVWRGQDGSYYCYTKECEHHLAPKQKKYIRVGVYRSGWRIRKVPGRNASEIIMVHQEDAGLNVEMAKMAFTNRIWSYVSKMNDALRKYSSGRQHKLNSIVSATTFIQKVPLELEVKNNATSSSHPENSTSSMGHQVGTYKPKTKKLTRKSSSKIIANGLLLVGGVYCLSRGHSSLGAKVAMAYMLGKLSKRGASTQQTDEIRRLKGNKALCGQPLGSCDPTIPPPNSEPNLHPSPPGANPEVNATDSNMSSGTRTAIIVVCVLLALFLLLLLVCLYRRKQNSPTPQLGRAVVLPSEAGVAAAAPTVVVASEPGSVPPKKADNQQPSKLSFVKDDRRKFDLQDLMRASAEVLGSGNFGASYKAVLVDGEALVVKRFKQMNSIGKEDFHEHMRRIGRLNHPNLLPLVAYLYRKEEKLLVFDYVHNGSLAACLHGKKTEEQPGLSWASRLRIIKGVAKGLNYLQTELPSLIVPHGHLKSSNVLLDKDFNPLLMDYTLVPIVNQDQVPQILVAYKSPEYAKFSKTSKKTDVWCLGILILETITGKFVAKYLDQGSGPYGSDLVEWINGIVQEAAENNTKVFDKEMNAPATCKAEMEKLLQIGIACCKEEMDERPDLEEVVRQIEQVQDSSLSSTDNL